MTRRDAFPRKPQGEPLTIEYFRERSTVDPLTGCWLWRGHCAKNGYGHTGVRRAKSKLAHRVAFAVANSREPRPLNDVCHSCDVRSCVNPDHLFEGTHTDNMQDCREKGRLRSPFYRGMAPTKTKLTAEAALEIRRDTARSNHQLARDYGVSRRAIQFIKSGRLWGNL